MRDMRIILVLVFLVFAPGLAESGALADNDGESGEESFLVGLSDIPLMPGLAQDEAASFLFDKPAGRILTARLHGCVEAADVRQYYGATLPQLGWLPAPLVSTATASTLIYRLEGDRLTPHFPAWSRPGPRTGSGTGSDEDAGCFEILLLLSPAAAGE